METMRKWRRHTIEFKRQVVERMKACENIEALARELDLERKLLYTWKYQFEGRPERNHASYGMTAEERKEQKLREENARLKMALAEKALEIDFFKSALLRVDPERRWEPVGNGGRASTKSSARGRRSRAC